MQSSRCEATPLHFVRVTSNQHVFINWALCWTLTHISLIDEFDNTIYFPLLKHVHVSIFIFPQCKFSKCLCFFNCICTAHVVLFIFGVFVSRIVMKWITIVLRYIKYISGCIIYKNNFRLRFLCTQTFVGADGLIVQYGNIVSIGCVTLYGSISLTGSISTKQNKDCKT